MNETEHSMADPNHTDALIDPYMQVVENDVGYDPLAGTKPKYIVKRKRTKKPGPEQNKI